MGTWGYLPFENDDAMDWLEELEARMTAAQAMSSTSFRFPLLDARQHDAGAAKQRLGPCRCRSVQGSEKQPLRGDAHARPVTQVGPPLFLAGFSKANRGQGHGHGKDRLSAPHAPCHWPSNVAGEGLVVAPAGPLTVLGGVPFPWIRPATSSRSKIG